MTSLWTEHPDNESPENVSSRLGISIEAAREHRAEHRCVDGRIYRYSCLVSDPSCDRVARSYMARTTERALE